MVKKRAFGELELTILNIFKKHNQLTVRQVVALLQEKDKYTTIMTIMNRLVHKKQLVKKLRGNQYEYCLNTNYNMQESSNHYVRTLVRLKELLFDAKTVSMVNFLLEADDKLTNAELTELENHIKKLKENKE